jgi:hypothetical protein
VIELGIGAELKGRDPMELQPVFVQMRCTLARDSPTSLANGALLQWVAALGLRKVALSTVCSLAAVMRRGPPGRDSVRNPYKLAIAPTPQTNRPLRYPKR